MARRYGLPAKLKINGAFFIRLLSLKVSSNESGSALIEFTLTSIILLVGVFGILDFSRVLYADHFVAYAAREATRYALVRGSTWTVAGCSPVSAFSCAATSGNIQDFVKSITPPGLDVNKLTITPGWYGVNSSGVTCSAATPNASSCTSQNLQVKVAYAFGFAIPFLPPSAAITLSSTSAVAIPQ